MYKINKNKKTIDSLFLEQKKYLENLRKSQDLTNCQDEPQVRISKALEDYEYFITTYFPHHLKNANGEFVKPAKFQIEAANSIMNSPNMFLAALVWARGHAKSTTAAFILIWLIINRKINFGYYVSATSLKVRMLMNTIKAEFEDNHLLNLDFGPFRTPDHTWNDDFIVIDKYDFALYTLSAGQNARGAKYKNYRPDFILLDDFDSDEVSRNEDRVEQMNNWLDMSLIPVSQPDKYRIIMIGNRFTHHMTLNHFCSNNKLDYYSQINIIDDNGEISWKEYWTEEAIEKRRNSIGSINFAREYMNTPVSVGKLFKKEQIIHKQLNLKEMDSQYIIAIDPSWTSGSKSDYKAICCMCKIGDYYYVDDIFLRRTNMEVLTDWLFTKYYNLKRQYIDNIAIYFESNFAQHFLAETIHQKEKEFGLHLPLILDKRAKIEKYARIESLYPFFERNSIIFNPDMINSSDYIEFENQLLSFSKNSKMNDDGPDALQYAFEKCHISGSRVDFDDMVLDMKYDKY